MMFTTPLGLLALLAIPAIVAIHLFRRRFPVRPVAGLFLWQLARQTPEGGGKIAKLPITTSLILECLAALALALILAGARLSSAGVSQHLVVLLDDSASMAAVNARGESARDRAVRRVLGELERLGAGARITLVSSGDRPSVLSGPAAFAVEARPALDKWKPEAPHHSLALGIRLARELAGRTGRLMVMSDLTPDLRELGLPAEAQGESAGAKAGSSGVREFESTGERLRPERGAKPPSESARGWGPARSDIEGALWVSVGEPLANVGITAAERTTSPGEGRGVVSLTLGNYSDSPARRRLSVSAPDKNVKNVLALELDVPPGVSSLTLPLPPGLPTVRVALSDDALLRDNVVMLAEPRPQVVGVENRLGEGRGREALVKALGALSGVTQAESGHLAFVDAGELDRSQSPGARPEVPEGVWRVGFGRAPTAWLAKGEAKDFIGPFVLEKRHPLLLGMTLGGVVWSGAAPLAAERQSSVDSRQSSSRQSSVDSRQSSVGGDQPAVLNVRPLVSAGDQVLIGLLGSTGARTEPTILFNLDLDRTNLIRAPDWPILISNLVEMRRQGLPGPERWNYRVGEWVRLRLGRDPKGPLRLRSGAVDRILPSGRQLEFIAPPPGGLLQILEADEVLFELGVNFLDESESNLRHQATADVGELADAAGLRAESGPASDPLFWVLLTIGGTAIVLNWCLLSPGRAGA